MRFRLAVFLALLAGCSGPSHPRAMGDRGAGSGLGVVGGGATGGGGAAPAGSGPAPAPTDAPPPPPPRGPAPAPPSDCETLGQCCAAMVGDDEVACLDVLQGYDEPRCRLGVDRFCAFAQICDADGCSSFGPGR